MQPRGGAAIRGAASFSPAHDSKPLVSHLVAYLLWLRGALPGSTAEIAEELGPIAGIIIGYDVELAALLQVVQNIKNHPRIGNA